MPRRVNTTTIITSKISTADRLLEGLCSPKYICLNIHFSQISQICPFTSLVSKKSNPVTRHATFLKWPNTTNCRSYKYKLYCYSPWIQTIVTPHIKKTLNLGVVGNMVYWIVQTKRWLCKWSVWTLETSLRLSNRACTWPPPFGSIGVVLVVIYYWSMSSNQSCNDLSLWGECCVWECQCFSCKT